MKEGDICYNEEIICPHQIDTEPCDCEWLPAMTDKELNESLAFCLAADKFLRGVVDAF